MCIIHTDSSSLMKVWELLPRSRWGVDATSLDIICINGGTHPKGKRVPYLNECAVPKFSYDYQAAIGEFGQVRKSFHQLKLQHLLYKEFEEYFTSTKTVLSKEAVIQKPEDVETLRYVVRVNESGRGFLFLNNYQDHVEMIDQKDFAVEVNTRYGKSANSRERKSESGKRWCLRFFQFGFRLAKCS